MSKRSTLELVWQCYSGNEPKPRPFLDFVIDGGSMFRLFKDNGLDVISCLGWGPNSEQLKAVRRLLLDAPADLPENRRSIYICHIDGDIACGAVTVKIETTDDAIIWKEFGFEYGYSVDGEYHVELDSLKDVGPFTFDKLDYNTKLQGLATSDGA
jgi:hypothetical protein